MYIPAKRDTIGPSLRDKDRIMDNTYHDNSEYSHRRRNAATTEAGSAHDTDIAVAYAGQAGSLLRSPGIGASHNASVRAAAMGSMQQTHGNRAVQRTLMGGTAGPIAVQRDIPKPLIEEPYGPSLEGGVSVAEEGVIDEGITMLGGEVCVADEGAIDGSITTLNTTNGAEEDYNNTPNQENSEDASNARKGRTAASKTATALREGSKALSAAGRGVSTAEETLRIEQLMGIPGRIEAAEGALKSAKGAQESSWVNRYLGTDSKVGKGLRGSNYALQFWENMTKGQDMDEALVGAAAGGYVNNNITRMLFDKSSFLHTAKPTSWGGMGPVSRNIGWVDTAANLVNAGLTLAGAPEEVTTVTQAVADATPSSFATSLASETSRGIYNLATGDLDALGQQRDDLIDGKGNKALQGYAVTGEAVHAWLSGDEEYMDRIREENARGKRGKLAQWGSRIGKWARGGEYDEWDAEREGGPEARDRFLRMRETEPARQAAWEKMDRQRTEADLKRKADFEKEMEALGAQIERGPAMPSTMLGGPGDALSARNMYGQQPQVDEDGEPVPYVPMALPGR
jgi:hypothetical protein